ncbi:hypothetical protein TNCV_2587281 [Trichonephila clavipes]|nr:hypothetical protein TNCV_2587281 [Trichonephila clavipes]
MWDECCVVVAANATYLTVSNLVLRNSSCQRARCRPVVSRRIEQHTGDSTIWLGFIPILRESTLEVVRGISPLFPFHRLHERTWLEAT